MKSKKVLFVIISLVLITIIVLIVKPKNYNVEYTVNNYNIKESYNSNKKEYILEINKDNKYSMIIESKYIVKHKIISDIKEYKNEETNCIIPIVKEIKTYPLCNLNGNNISSSMISGDLKSEMDISTPTEDLIYSKENIDIFNQDKSYLIWQYKNFLNLSDSQKMINIFTTDKYDISLATKINNYILIPNYNQEYNFNEFYIINLKNLKIETMKIKYDISFDSYILGTFNKSVYLVDKKNKVEYEIVPHRKKIRVVGNETKDGIIYNGDWENISLNKLSIQNNSFTNQESISYFIKDNTLYHKIKNIDTQVSNKKVKDIIFQDKQTIYYLVDDTLYKYNPFTQEQKLLTYFEWNFNYKNQIFIY